MVSDIRKVIGRKIEPNPAAAVDAPITLASYWGHFWRRAISDEQAAFLQKLLDSRPRSNAYWEQDE